MEHILFSSSFLSIIKRSLNLAMLERNILLAF
ncbi:unnamed protein product [Schistosoma margrebowiei]|uniref:Uncharacterized protein n=1 Tax=Schistosoma margrebowiei TaxID=48269 RepID=A0A183LG22_9TREM|nr:unnamed protein product [Schistosoma margrebowiei]